MKDVDTHSLFVSSLSLSLEEVQQRLKKSLASSKITRENFTKSENSFGSFDATGKSRIPTWKITQNHI